MKTWKTSTDPDYEAKKNRVLELYAIADGRTDASPGDPTVVFCMDEFGPLNLQPTRASSGRRPRPAREIRAPRGDAADGRPTPGPTACGT